MNKALYKWYSHILRSGSVHDDHPDLSNQLLKEGKVVVVKTWRFQGKNCRIIQAKTDKPDWVKIGEKCNVWGEGADEFIIKQITPKGVVLDCGFESFDKLHREYL